MIFNTFVWLQIFNFFNARRIRDELNIFEGFFNNYLFLFIVFLIIFLQAFIVTHGSVAFHVYNWYDNNTGGAGLNIHQWLICIGFGAGGIVVSFLLKFFPEQKCLEVYLIMISGGVIIFFIYSWAINLMILFMIPLKFWK